MRQPTRRIYKHAPHWNEAVPQDPEEFRMALARRIHDFLGEWRTCRMPLCRRQRSCVSRNFACAEGREATSQSQWARVQAQLRRALAARNGQADDEGSAESSAPMQAAKAARVTRPKTACRCRK